MKSYDKFKFASSFLVLNLHTVIDLHVYVTLITAFLQTEGCNKIFDVVGSQNLITRCLQMVLIFYDILSLKLDRYICGVTLKERNRLFHAFR